MDMSLQRESSCFALDDQVELEVPCAEDSSQTLSDWCQWGFIRPEKFDDSSICSGRSEKSVAYESTIARHTVPFELIKIPLVHRGEESNPRDYKEVIVGYSSRTFEASAEGQRECQLQNDMDWRDQILRDSLIQEDKGNMQKILQPFNILDSISESQSSENFLTDMLTDVQSLKGDRKRMEASKPTSNIQPCKTYMSESWDKIEDSSPSCLMIEDYNTSEISATNASNKSEAVASADELSCWDTSVLLEFEDIMIHMNENLRICFRDSLNHLANNSKDQQAINNQNTAINSPPFMEVKSESPSLGGSRHGESRTNVVDRTTANLMSSEHYFHAPEVLCSRYRQLLESLYSAHN